MTNIRNTDGLEEISFRSRRPTIVLKVTATDILWRSIYNFFYIILKSKQFDFFKFVSFILEMIWFKHNYENVIALQ